MSLWIEPVAYSGLLTRRASRLWWSGLARLPIKGFPVRPIFAVRPTFPVRPIKGFAVRPVKRCIVYSDYKYTQDRPRATPSLLLSWSWFP